MMFTKRLVYLARAFFSLFSRRGESTLKFAVGRNLKKPSGIFFLLVTPIQISNSSRLVFACVDVENAETLTADGWG